MIGWVTLALMVITAVLLVINYRVLKGIEKKRKALSAELEVYESVLSAKVVRYKKHCPSMFFYMGMLTAVRNLKERGRM